MHISIETQDLAATPVNISIETQGLTATPAISAWVHGQVGSALGRFESGIRKTDVHLSESHEPKGVTAMSATITVFLKHRAPVRITTVHSNLYTALSITAKRIERALERNVVRTGPFYSTERRRWLRGDTLPSPI